MPVARAVLVALVLLVALPATAQDRLSADDFLDRVTGRTATFVMYYSGNLVGVEQFLRRDRTVWARSDGSCAYGTVFVREGQVCFSYDDERPPKSHCWVPFEVDDTLVVAAPDGSEFQRIDVLNDDRVVCEPPPTS
ncbi:hypothetical protein [uncultured Roseobacter sp.]|uniref:hypothetical protein n=1 Tax=uncultured Roseobacter sp. TaxID=114847 RepID=UPI00262D4F66|nr:hypothetical protein [uncultured Roseobacter sp.]